MDDTNFDGSALGGSESPEEELQQEITPEGLGADGDQPEEVDSFTNVDTSDLSEAERETAEARKKEMQADYTRKMQALAEERESLAEARVKASNYDKMMANPQALAQAAALAGVGANGQGDSEPEADPFDAFEPDQAAVLRKAVAGVAKKQVDAFKEELQSELAPYRAFINSAHTEKYEKQCTDVFAKFPWANTSEVKAKMTEAITNSNGVIRDPLTALKVVEGARVDETIARSTAAKRTAATRKATIPDQTTSTRVAAPQKKKATSLMDALLQAQEEAGVRVVSDDGNFLNT